MRRTTSEVCISSWICGWAAAMAGWEEGLKKVPYPRISRAEAARRGLTAYDFTIAPELLRLDDWETRTTLSAASLVNTTEHYGREWGYAVEGFNTYKNRRGGIDCVFWLRRFEGNERWRWRAERFWEGVKSLPGAI